MSAAPQATWSAQPAGTRNSRSKRPCWGPWSIPQTSGDVLRKLTAHTRGRRGAVRDNFQSSRANVPVLQPVPVRILTNFRLGILMKSALRVDSLENHETELFC